MTEQQKKLGQTLWAIADQLRGAMNADDFRDYMLAFLFLRHISDNYEQAARRELGRDWPDPDAIGNGGRSFLSVWYDQNPDDVLAFEKQMRRKTHHVIRPEHLRAGIAHGARTRDGSLLDTLREGFRYIENESFQSTFSGLFSEVNLGADKLGRTYEERNAKLCAIVTLDSQAPNSGPRRRLASVLDFACGSGSLLLNVRKRMGPHGIGRIVGQEKNITTCNLARMNMLLHGVKDTEFEIFHGDTLTNDWDMLRETNPPFSYRWDPTEALGEDVRFRNCGLAPKSAADFAFLLHGFPHLRDDGVMAIILPHGVLFRGGAAARIRRKLLDDGHIDTVIGLPANLFYSTGIPVCIVLFVNASGHFEKGKRQNALSDAHVGKSVERYARRVAMDEIAANDFNLNIARYVSTAPPEEEIDLTETHGELVEIETQLQASATKHNAFLEELGLPPLPAEER